MDRLKDLNDAQKQAALHLEGPLLIVAGAGAGKTKTIIERIITLIKKGVPPEEILAVTFTNKAAREITARIETAISGDSSLNLPVANCGRPFAGTFHTLGLAILKENAGKAGLPRYFSIYDRDDSRRLIKNALIRMDIDPKEVEPGRILNIISRQKADFVDHIKYKEERGNGFIPELVAQVWEHYEKALRDEKALDFDDLILKAAALLRKNPEVRAHYENRFRYLHIDEYQDTNVVQYEIARLIAGERRNICAVGDADQNIYTWRGANLKNLLRFERDYPGARVILLEENYRSTKTILDAANNIIEKNQVRVPKILRTVKPAGEKIGLYTAYDEEDEAFFVADTSKRLLGRGVKAEEIAVLYRANFQSRVLENAFLSAEVPYQLIGIHFFERKEVKDLLSYLRLALGGENPADLTRTINTPSRGIGKVSLIKILAGRGDELPPTMRSKVEEFREIIRQIRADLEYGTASEAVKNALVKSGLEEMLRRGGDEDRERLENLRELVTLSRRYDHRNALEGIEELLADAALQSDQDELGEEKGGVKLMTVHAAKGLEFDIVFVTGLEDDLFPHKKLDESEVSEEEAEEERRLMYVAITRARKKLFLTHSAVRTIFGNREVRMPSEFISDIDSDLMSEEHTDGKIKTIYF